MENTKLETFEEKIVNQYLTFGSVNEVYRKNQYNLPVSPAEFHRILNRYEIVKAAGTYTKLSEILLFLNQFIEKKSPIESIYKTMPVRFETSIQTIYRVIQSIKRKTVRRHAVALIVSPHNNSDRILIGNDISTPRTEIGKNYGSISLPMGFSKNNEESMVSIRRVLQREVFTGLTLQKKLPLEEIEISDKPFTKIIIADVLVSAYHLKLGVGLEKKVSSPILSNMHFEKSQKIQLLEKQARSGVLDITRDYELKEENELETKLSTLNRKVIFEDRLVQNSRLLPLQA